MVARALELPGVLQRAVQRPQSGWVLPGSGTCGNHPATGEAAPSHAQEWKERPLELSEPIRARKAQKSQGHGEHPQRGSASGGGKATLD